MIEDGELYQPSNGTEGVHFTEMYCMQCINCDPDPDGEKQCEIWMRSMCYDTKDKEYPKEWCYDSDGQPTCTAWVKWDWGNDDDPDGRNEPPVKIPDDPNQLCLPFEINEILEGHQIKELELLES